MSMSSTDTLDSERSNAIIRTDSPIGVVMDFEGLKKKARFDDEPLRNKDAHDAGEKESSFGDDFESDGDESQEKDSEFTEDSGPYEVNQDNFRDDFQSSRVQGGYNENDGVSDSGSEKHQTASPNPVNEELNSEEESNINGYPSNEDKSSIKDETLSQHIQDTTSPIDSEEPRDSTKPASPTGHNNKDNIEVGSRENAGFHGSRENTNTSLLSRRSGGRRHSSGNSRSPPRKPVSSKDPRHYTTMKTKDEDGRIKYDNISLKSASSRTSGLLSNLLNLMSSRFIYQSDPFEGALRRCPKVAFSVVEKATTPVAIEIMFGNPQKQTLPSYYYTSTDRNSALSRRAGSRLSRSSSAQSVSVGEKGNLPAVDSPRGSPTDLSRHEIDAFIPEEDENIRPKKKSGKTNKDGSLPNILVSDHSLPQNHGRRSSKRPVTSSSTKTNKSLGLPGKPMKS